MIWPFRRREVDHEGLLRSLGIPMPRSDMDRFRDFRAVFMGNEQGKRVLRDILEWGHVWQSSMAPDPNQVMFSEGERNLALKIMAAVHNEPVERPTHTNRKPKVTI